MHESGVKESSGCKYRGRRHKHITGNQICRCGCPLLERVCRGEREDITGCNGQRDEEEMCEEMETRKSEMQEESWPRSGIMEVKKNNGFRRSK